MSKSVTVMQSGIAVVETTKLQLEVEQSANSDQVFVTLTDKTNPKIASVVIGIYTMGDKLSVGVPYSLIRVTRRTSDGIEVDMSRRKTKKRVRSD